MTRRASVSAADKAQARKELAEQLHASIADKVEALTNSDQWIRFLEQSAAFHAYSTGRVAVFDPANSGTQEWRSAA